MLKSSYNLGRVWGIPIRIHISLIILLPLLMFHFGNALIPILLFASIALHELGHSRVAMNKGAYVQEIILLPIGGMAKIAELPKRPRDEMWMAFAGPLVSLGIGVGGIGIAMLIGGWLGTTLLYVGAINLVLGTFNLLPAFPMDGGRILRAWLTPKKGRVEATRIAAGVGKFCAVLFGIYAVTKGLVFLVLIAIYVYQAAKSEYRMVLIQEGRAQAPSGNPFFQQGGFSRPDNDLHAEVSPPPYAKKEDPFDQSAKRIKNFCGKWFK
ncbi:site-2 protease family protein [Verrucomicrobiota bacterium]